MLFQAEKEAKAQGHKQVGKTHAGDKAVPVPSHDAASQHAEAQMRALMEQQRQQVCV
jgi:hypothetical protein